jgi:hypothetical protein
MAKSFISFVMLERRQSNRKTDVWRVAPACLQGVGGPIDLGEVKFYPQWRKYCFFPFVNTVFDTACLEEIAGFCAMKTLLWRKGNGRTNQATAS